MRRNRETGLVDKCSLIDRMEAERARWKELLARAGEDRLCLPGVEGEWTLKDVVAHVSAYERGLVDWLSAALEGRVAEFPLLDHPDLDYRNEEIYLSNRDLPARQVLDTADTMFQRLLELIRRLSEEELTDAARTEWYVKPRWNQARALWECIADDSYRHYQQHIPGIEEWLRRQGTRKE